MPDTFLSRSPDYRREYQREYKARPEKRELMRRLQKDWRDKNKDKIRNNNLRRIGTSIAEVDLLRLEQADRCAICETDLSALPPKQVHTDHCHTTNKIRGILCHGCNTGIGALRDDPELLRRALTYLERN